MRLEPAHIVDPALERRAGVIAARLALAEQLPLKQADAIVISVLRAMDFPVETVASSPEREHLIAPLRQPPIAWPI